MWEAGKNAAVCSPSAHTPPGSVCGERKGMKGPRRTSRTWRPGCREAAEKGGSRGQGCTVSNRAVGGTAGRAQGSEATGGENRRAGAAQSRLGQGQPAARTAEGRAAAGHGGEDRLQGAAPTPKGKPCLGFMVQGA